MSMYRLLGNKADVGFVDATAVVAQRSTTEALMFYLERLDEGDAFLDSTLTQAGFKAFARRNFAARAAGVLPGAAKTLIPRLTNSLASLGNRSVWNSALRYSIVASRPSTIPTSASP